MTTNMNYVPCSTITTALKHLNDVTGPERMYNVTQQGDAYALSIPLGGSYPACDAQTMASRLVWLRIAAVGREAR